MLSLPDLDESGHPDNFLPTVYPLGQLCVNNTPPVKHRHCIKHIPSFDRTICALFLGRHRGLAANSP